MKKNVSNVNSLIESLIEQEKIEFLNHQKQQGHTTNSKSQKFKFSKRDGFAF